MSNYFSGELYESLLKEEQYDQKKKLYHLLISPFIDENWNNKVIIDIGPGIGSAEAFLLETIPKHVSLKIILIEKDKNMLNYTLKRMENIVKHRKLTNIEIIPIHGDYTQIDLSSLVNKADGIIFGSVLHELYGEGGLEKLRKGMKLLNKLLKNNGVLSLYEFADLAYNEYISINNIIFESMIPKEVFINNVRNRYKAYLKYKSMYSPDYELKGFDKVPKAFIIDTIYGISVKQPPDHLHTLCFSKAGLNNLLLEYNFNIIDTKEVKLKGIMQDFARKCGILNHHELVEMLPPDRYYVYATKSQDIV